MYQIAICDDDVIFAHHLQKNIQNWFQSIPAECEFQVYTNGNALLSSAQPVQIYFLDIEIPDFSGFDLARIIHSRNPLVPVVFVSSYESTVFDSFQYNPLRFVRKTHLEKDLAGALTAFLSQQDKSADTQSMIHLTVKNQPLDLPLSELLYIESQLHYLYFHFLSGNYHIRGKLSDYQNLLSAYPFAMPCRGILVQLNMISTIQSNEIILKNNITLPLSRTYRKEFLHQYMQYQKENYHVISI